MINTGAQINTGIARYTRKQRNTKSNGQEKKTRNAGQSILYVEIMVI